jgi:hypothetical protein
MLRPALRSLCFLLLIVLAATAAQAQAASGAASNLSFLDGKSSFNVPFELVDNRIFVDVWLDGKGPFKFILDTGGYGGLSNEVAHKIGAKLGAEVQGRGAGEKVVTARQTSVVETRIGGLALKDQDYTVYDFSDMRHIFGSQMFDGVIGLPVFSQTVVRVDYERSLLTFTRPSRFSYRGPGTVVPFELERFLPIVRGEIEGVAARFGLDTGDRSTFTLKTPFVEEHKLRERYEPRVEAVTGWGIGGPIRAQVVRIGDFKFGGFEFRSMLTRLSLQKAGAFTSNDVAGNIGAGLLKQFNVTFDYSRRRLIFEKNRNYGRNDSYDRAGLWLSQSADGKSFEVFDVVAHGPAAEAGIKVGDRVLAIDGTGTQRLQLIAARTELKDAKRKSVRLLVEADGKPREVVVVLRDLV